MRSLAAPFPASLTRWDRLGIGLSGLCALHCLATPVALALLPLWPSLDALHAWLHPVLALLLVPVTVLAMWGAHRAHRPHRLQAGFAIGLALVLLALPAGHATGWWLETSLTLVGSALLIAAHVGNWRAAHPPRRTLRPIDA